MSTCPTNPEATVDKDGFCTAHGNDCADYAASRREERTTTAYLSDGRHIDVPRSDAQDWAREAAELDTTIGLADWYTDQGDERQDEIQGKPRDDPRCEHHDAETTVLVVNTSQVETYHPEHPHASTRVCDARACILDAMAWVERATGEEALWIRGDGFPQAAPPSVHRIPALPTAYEEFIESAGTEPAAGASVQVGLLTWGPGNGDLEEFIVVATDETTARRTLVAKLITTYGEAPDLFHDDAPIFMTGGEPVAATPAKDFVYATASDDELDAWLVSFREATTAPWWTITETAIVA